ncbi:MAG: hypothetical protein FJ215_09560 [Ignavibacteria bacterium]|nr:hypothetical protein [Ignavibacteria bacterium]
MKRHNWVHLRTGLCILAITAFASPLQAQFAEDALRFSQYGLGVGARSLGLGNTSIGAVNDYSALFSNPGGLALIRDFEFSVGLSYHGYNNDVKFFGNELASSRNFSNLNSLGLVYPIPTTRGSLTFAFAFGRVADFGTTAEFKGFNPSSSLILAKTPVTNLASLSINERKGLLDNNIPYQLFLADTLNGKLVSHVNGNVQQSVVVHEGGGLNHWSFGGAIDIAKDISFGASLNIVSGSYTYERDYAEDDTRNFYQRLPGESLGRFDHFSLVSTIDGELNGVNGLLGLMYRRPGKFHLGLTVRTPTTISVNENYSDEARSRFDPNANGSVDRFDISFDGKTEYRVITPAMFGAGLSIQLREWLMIAGDVEYADWTQIEFNSSNPDLLAENRLIKRIFRPTTNLRGGVELSLWNHGIQLRGGVNWKPSPYENDPPEYDQLYYTAGIGFQLDAHMTLNGAFAIGSWKTFRDNYSMTGLPSASRTAESVSTNNLNVTLTYRF